jgi:hypothetical protein
VKAALKAALRYLGLTPYDKLFDSISRDASCQSGLCQGSDARLGGSWRLLALGWESLYGDYIVDRSLSVKQSCQGIQKPDERDWILLAGRRTDSHNNLRQGRILIFRNPGCNQNTGTDVEYFFSSYPSCTK